MVAGQGNGNIRNGLIIGCLSFSLPVPAAQQIEIQLGVPEHGHGGVKEFHSMTGFPPSPFPAILRYRTARFVLMRFLLRPVPQVIERLAVPSLRIRRSSPDGFSWGSLAHGLLFSLPLWNIACLTILRATATGTCSKCSSP